LVEPDVVGKSGPLFNLNIKEIKILSDGTIERPDAPVKVVDRRWYEKNKQSHPVNRWQVYDPNKVYDKHTISGV
jgi:protein FAM50